MKKVYICSLSLSILHSILFWNKQIGISMILFIATAIILLIYLLKVGNKIQNEKELFWSIPILLLSGTYFIFNNEIFRILNMIAIILLMSIMIIGITKKRKTIQGYFLKTIEIIVRPFELIHSIIEDLKNRVTSKFEKKENDGLLKKIIKAIITALPIVIVVLMLLASADTIFREMFSSIGNILKNIQVHELVFRILLALILFIYFACFSVNLIKKDSPYNEEKDEGNKSINVEVFTINMILILLNIIYLVFSIIQFQNLFTHLGEAREFNFAQYARQGFFQLMLVSFINFAIIFVATINKEEEAVKDIKLRKLLEILLILFTIVIIVSAYIRMYLYEQAYGYTHLRLFVYTVLITELISMIPVIAYILGAKFNLLKSIVIIITTMYVGLNYINIDELIAKKNIDRYFSAQEIEINAPIYKEIDLQYLMKSTRTDAIPQMMRLLESDNQDIVRSVEIYLRDQLIIYKNKNKNWQEFNISIQKIKDIDKID